MSTEATALSTILDPNGGTGAQPTVDRFSNLTEAELAAMSDEAAAQLLRDGHTARAAISQRKEAEQAANTKHIEELNTFAKKREDELKMYTDKCAELEAEGRKLQKALKRGNLKVKEFSDKEKNLLYGIHRAEKWLGAATAASHEAEIDRLNSANADLTRNNEAAVERSNRDQAKLEAVRAAMAM